MWTHHPALADFQEETMKKGDGFVSPVSKLRQVESDALRRQRQRMQALEQEVVATTTKRKASETSTTDTVVLDAAARAAARRKKQRRETLDLNEVEREEADLENEELIKRLEADLGAMDAAAKVILQPTPAYEPQRVVEEGDAHALPLFSRFNDQSVRESRSVTYAASSSEGSSSSLRRRLKHFDSLNILRENIAVRDEEDEDEEDGSPSKGGLLPRPGVLLPSVMDEEFVDLDKIANVSALETVEGSAILDVLMNTSSVSHHSRVTTRKAYHKEVHDASEEREREFLRRRRLALRNRMPSMVQRANANWDRDYKEEEEEAPDGKRSQEEATEDDDEEADDRIEATDVYAEENEVQQAIEGETMQSKMQDVQLAKQVHWKRTLVRIAVGTSALCALVAAAAVMPILLAPSVPYCSTSDAGNEVVTSKFDHSMALQPYIGDAGSSSCRSCPVYAHCSDGKVVSCQPSYELHSGNCVESEAINHDLRQVAAAIGQFVTKQATEHVCNTSFWSSVFSRSATDSSSAVPTNETKSSSRMLLSDLYAFMTSSLSFGPAASGLSREYLFSRALDIALRDLSDISVDGEEHLIVGVNVRPLFCRAKNQLYAYAPTIALMVLAAIVLGFLYKQIAVYRAKQALVDRLVKEVRAFLLARTAKAERFYSGEHLRDDLLDALPASSLDRAWLRRVVWPKVVAVVKEDSRIHCRNATIDGQQVAVWEWLSSVSPPVRKYPVGRIDTASKQQITLTRRKTSRTTQKPTAVVRRSARFADEDI